MKKALTILLAVAMMFCFSATAFAADFNDTSDCSKVAQDAINKVAALGIVEGYEDGSFKPAENITRAEFAKMADIAAGFSEKTAEDLEGAQSSYPDVKTNVWYTGWINLASAQGYVKGYETGTYGPNNNITYAEVTTVLMRLLGYNDNLTGPWPINYINQATKLDVLDDVEGFSANVPATRENVAIMLAETLDQNMVKWSSDDNEFQDKLKDMDGDKKAEETYTLLQDSFNGVANSYIITNVDKSDLVDGEFDIDAVLKDKVDGETGANVADLDAYVTKVNAISSASASFTAYVDTPVAGGNIAALKGMEVTIVADEDDEAQYIQVDSTIVESEKAEADGVRFKLDDKSYKTANINFGAAYKAADVNVTGYAILNSDNEIMGLIKDKDADAAAINPAPEYVTSVDNAEKDQISINGKKTDVADDDAIIIKDGKRVTAKDLAVGDVLNKYADVDDTYIVTATKESKITSAKGNPVTSVVIDGTTYDIQTAVKFDSDYEKDSTIEWSDYIGKDIKYVLAADNTIAAAVFDGTGESSDMYGVITDVVYQTTKGNADAGKPYKKVTLYTDKGETTEFDVDTDAATNLIADTLDIGDVIKYQLNKDNEIKKAEDVVNTLATLAFTDQEAEVDKEYLKEGNFKYTINDNAIIFNIKDDCEVELMTKDAVLAGDDFKAATVDDVDAYGPTDKVLSAIVDGTKIKVLVVTNANAVSDWQYAIVKDILGDDGDKTNAVTFTNLEGTYELDGATNEAAVTEDALVAIKLDGTDIDSALALAVDGTNPAATVNEASLAAMAKAVLDLNSAAVKDTNYVLNATGVKVNGNLVSYDGGHQFEVTADTVYMYLNADDEWEATNELDDDAIVSAIINEDGEAELLIVVNR